MHTRSINISALPANHNLRFCRIEGMLGFGVFGITYRANDTDQDNVVAIKEYYPNAISTRKSDFSIQPKSPKYNEQYYLGLKNFIELARVIGNFDHLCFTRVHSYFEANNSAYVIMRYEKGQNIRGIRISRQFAEGELLDIASNILDALDSAHQNNLIHDNIRPENIIIRDDGSPVLVNFGSVSQPYRHFDRKLTRQLIHEYSPIEKFHDHGDEHNHGVWSDIYSMSATLYYTISGIAPSAAKTRSDSIQYTRRDTCVPIELIARGQYSRDFLRAIDRGLAFDHRERPQSIAELRSMYEHNHIIM